MLGTQLIGSPKPLLKLAKIEPISAKPAPAANEPVPPRLCNGEKDEDVKIPGWTKAANVSLG